MIEERRSMATVSAESALTASLDDLRALSEYVNGRVGETARDSLSVLLDQALAAVAAHHKTTDRRATAMLMHGGFVFYGLTPALGIYLRDRRVPCLDPDHTAVSWAGGEAPGVVTMCGDFAALRDDAEESDGVTLVDTLEDLRDTLHDEIVRWSTPAVETMAARGPIGRRALWLAVSDVVAGGLQWIGELAGDIDRGEIEGQQLIGRPGSPLRSPRARFGAYSNGTITERLFLRASCCLSYRLDEGDYCLTCPLIDETQRRSRVDAWLTTL